MKVRNVTTLTDVVPASLTWDAASTSAVIQFATPTLPDGNYTLTISGLASPTPDYTGWFSELGEYTNGDPGAAQSLQLRPPRGARNYNAAGEATLAQGDVNSDRSVNFADLLTLARNYNNVLGRSVRVAGPADGGTSQGRSTSQPILPTPAVLAGVQFLVNGVAVGTEDTTAPYSLAWDSTSIPNGTYQVTAVARGGNGSTTTSEPIGITVDNPDVTPPSVSLSNPADDATVSGTVSVSVGASDNVGVVGVQFLVDGVWWSGRRTRGRRTLSVGFQDLSATARTAWRRGRSRARPGARDDLHVSLGPPSPTRTRARRAVLVGDGPAPRGQSRAPPNDGRIL